MLNILFSVPSAQWMWLLQTCSVLCLQVVLHSSTFKATLYRHFVQFVWVLTTNKTHHVITMLCVWNFSVKLNMYVTLWSNPPTEVTKCRTIERDTIHHNTYFKNYFMSTFSERSALFLQPECFELKISKCFRKALVKSRWLVFFSRLCNNYLCIFVSYGSWHHPHPPCTEVVISNKIQIVNHKGALSIMQRQDIVVLETRRTCSSFFSLFVRNCDFWVSFLTR